MKKVMLAFILGMILISFANASTETYPFNQEVNLILTCTIDNAIPSESATMNLTIAYPNGTLFLDAVNATPLGSGIFNYTTTFPIIGTYHPTLLCVDGSNSNSNSDGVYEVTPDGLEMSIPKIIVEVFASISTLFLMILFLYLSGTGIKSGMAKAEQGASRFLFLGLSLVFLIAHIIITNIIIHDTLGQFSSMATAYTAVMYIFFTIIILVFLYTLIKVMIWEIDIFMKSKGLR